jgi:hypothetical protein
MDFVSVATARGANAGLHKPFNDLDLVETIRALLQPVSVVPMQASAA